VSKSWKKKYLKPFSKEMDKKMVLLKSQFKSKINIGSNNDLLVSKIPRGVSTLKPDER
jgi:hypothetical protein